MPRTLTIVALAALLLGAYARLDADILYQNQELSSSGLWSSNGYVLKYELWPNNPSQYWLKWTGAYQNIGGWNTYMDGGLNGYAPGNHMSQSVLTSCEHAILQNDGNFVCYNANWSQALWETDTVNGFPTILNAQNDGNLVIYLYYYPYGWLPMWAVQ